MNNYEASVICLSFLLFAGWTYMCIRLYRLQLKWRAYGSILMAMGYGLLVYRALTHYDAYITHITMILHLSALICFIQVIRIIEHDQKN